MQAHIFAGKRKKWNSLHSFRPGHTTHSIEALRAMNPPAITTLMDDDEINLSLDDPALDRKQEGLRYALLQFKAPLLTYLKWRGVVAREDQEDIIYDTFAALYEWALAGKIDLNQPLKNFLFNVADRKRIDMWRKREVRIPHADESHQLMADVLLDNSATQRWHELKQRAKTKEIFEGFILEIPSLPKRQQQVAVALSILFAANDKITVSGLRDMIEKLTGEAPPMPSVKSAWDAIRQNLEDRIVKEL